MFIFSRFTHTQAHNDKSGGEKKKKESIVDLSKYLEKAIRIKFQGGREGKFD